MCSKRLCELKCIFKFRDFNNYIFKTSLINRSFSNTSGIITAQTNLNSVKNSNVALPNIDTRIVKVAIIGMPNAGKSTLINQLMDRTVCATSKKVHTTRKRNYAIRTDGNTQIIFLDTPGIVSGEEKKRFNLEKSFENDCTKSLCEADVIGVIHDVHNNWTREKLDRKLIRLLEQHESKNSFLVMNKIDTLKSKRKLLELIRSLTENCSNFVPIHKREENKGPKNRGWSKFSEIFMVSALNGDGVDDIKKYLFKQSYPAKWLHDKYEWTDQLPEDIIGNIVKATLLDFLPQEIPYRLKTELEFFEISNDGVINTVALVWCPNDRIKNFVVGIGDGKLRQITGKIQQELMNAFKLPVRVKIIVNIISSNSKS